MTEKEKLEKIISDSLLLNELYNALTDIDKGILIYGMGLAYTRGLNDYTLSCKHQWVRTTRNYKSVKKCYLCGEIKTS